MWNLLRCVVAIAAILTVGCGVDAGETSNGGTAGAGGDGGGGGSPDCPEDPADGPVPSACGIWVSASRGFDDLKGTKKAPVRTLARAIELAAEGPGRVYACNETWFEELQVPAHVSLHGGFDCENDWAYVGGDGKRAMITPIASTGLTWVEGETTEKTFFTDFYVEALDADDPGESSIGVFIRDDVPLKIRRCEIIAGPGRDGLDGADAEDGTPMDPGTDGALDGIPGEAGSDACSAPVSKGGAGPERVCPMGMSKGGAGGDAGLMTAYDGGQGEPANEANSGTPGLGQTAAAACTTGGHGAPGLRGMTGKGGDLVLGQVTAAGFISSAGKDGQWGQNGGGGGGGGGSLGSVAACGGASSGGAAGGSGSTGGCAGAPGHGGQGGGSSIGILVHVSFPMIKQVTIEGSHVVVGNGGTGGNGGRPQDGGYGLAGGAGGAGVGAANPGCAGGWGGSGGDGGWGGGGAGGNSLCLAFMREAPSLGSPQWLGGMDCDLGESGNGGHGNPDDKSGAGGAGLANDAHFFLKATPDGT